MTWQEVWQSVLNDLAAIEKLYRQHEAPADPATVVRDFFVHCDSLEDWIAKTLNNPPRLRAFVKGKRRTLWAAHAMSVITKHKTPDNKVPAGQISASSITADGVGFMLTIHDPGVPPAQQTWEVDALVLARDCVADWQTFFAANGLDPTS